MCVSAVIGIVDRALANIPNKVYKIIMSEQAGIEPAINSYSNVRNSKYLSKKTLAQGMFDVALLSSNTNQLVHLVQTQTGDHTSGFHTTAIVLLIISIILQIFVGACLIIVAISNSNNPTRKIMIRRLNNLSTVLIFFITIINVLIPSFTPSYQYPKPSTSKDLV